AVRDPAPGQVGRLRSGRRGLHGDVRRVRHIGRGALLWPAAGRHAAAAEGRARLRHADAGAGVRFPRLAVDRRGVRHERRGRAHRPADVHAAYRRQRARRAGVRRAADAHLRGARRTPGDPGAACHARRAACLPGRLRAGGIVQEFDAMKIAVIGAGPAGLYFALLAKKHNPRHDIQVYEQNPRGATYGWGVVFSDIGLAFLREADPEFFQTFVAHHERCDYMEIVHRGTRVQVQGNHFSRTARLDMLEVLEQACLRAGVRIAHDRRIEDVERLAGEVDMV